MNIKYIFLFFFLMVVAIVYSAENIRVMYFYSSACPASRNLEPFAKEIKDFWKDKVEWSEYNFMNDNDLSVFESYGIANVPVAIVNCFNESFRIERGEIENKLNQSIAYCYSLEEAEEISSIEEKQTSRPFPAWMIVLILFFGLIGLRDLKKK